MNVVIDTNVIVSGLLSPFQAPAEILRMLITGRLTLCVDSRIIAEYRDVLNRPKFCFDKVDVDNFLTYVTSTAVHTTPQPLTHDLPDPDDEPFLETAIAGKAACIITGNATHFPKTLCKGIKVFSPQAFCAWIKSKH